MTTSSRARVTPAAIRSRKRVSSSEDSRKISALTAYDYTWAKIFDEVGVDLLLVGDSLGMVVQGHKTTIPVTIDQVIYHTRCVSAAVERALVVADLPFLSYRVSIESSLLNAGRLIQEGGAAAVKLEGGILYKETVERLVNADIPVIGHIGLTPQSYHRMGGYRIQGKHGSSFRKNGLKGKNELLEDARALEEAGVFAIVLEGMISDVAQEITEQLSIPTIGIGAGPHCDGQILVSTDMLGLNVDSLPKFVEVYAPIGEMARKAVEQYLADVQSGEFPAERHSYRD